MVKLKNVSQCINYLLSKWYSISQFPANNITPSSKNKTNRSSTVTINTRKTFPFLDIEFSWSARKILGTRVFLKKNQHLKYMKADSKHTNTCIKAIPKGVLMRLSKLTSLNAGKHDKPIKLLYPEHAKRPG